MATKSSSSGSRKAVKPVKKGTPAPKRTKSVEVSTFDATAHRLVPAHQKLSDKEADAVRKEYHAALKQLPKIRSNDAAIFGLGAKEGDIIKVIRKSQTAGEAIFYRGVIDE